MKNSSEYANRLSRLCRRVRRQMGAPEDHELTDPLTEVIQGCLSFYTTESKAHTALNKLRSHFVDFNELRVCREHEVGRILGTSFPQAKEAARMIIKSLQTIYAKRDSLDLGFLRTEGKRDAKAFLESIEAVGSYVVARVMLRSIGGHAFPVHDKLVTVLQKEEVIDPKADIAEVQGFLERQISSKTIQKTYTLLRKYSDGYRATKSRSDREAASKKTKAKSTTSTKKPTKKKSATKKS